MEKKQRKPRPVASFAQRQHVENPSESCGSKPARPSMARDMGTEAHSHSVVFCREPRWGIESELIWRRKRLSQLRVAKCAIAEHSYNASTSTESRRPSTSGTMQPASTGAAYRISKRSDTDVSSATMEQRFRQLSSAGARRLVDAERSDRQTRNIARVLRSALNSRRGLYGHSIVDSKTVFEMADIDGSGALDRFEFRRAMRRLGLGLTANQIEEVVKLVDANGDGEIAYDEFVNFLHSPAPPPPPNPAEEASARLVQPKEDQRSPWSWERPWRANMRSTWDLDRTFVRDAHGAVICKETATAGELSREELRHSRELAARSTPAASRANILSVSAWPLLGPGFFRIKVAGAAPADPGGHFGPACRRPDGSRPSRYAAREWLKGNGFVYHSHGLRGWYKDIELSISTDEHPVNKMLEKIKAIADVLGMGYAVELQQPDELNEHNFSGGSNAILAEPENGLPEATQLKSISRRLAWSQNVEALERSTGIRPTYEPRTDRS